MTDELLDHVRNGRWGEALAIYPGPKAVADDGRLEPLEAAALLALDDARRAGRRAWLVDKYDEVAWEAAGAPAEGGQFRLVSVHASPVEAARRLAWLLEGETTTVGDAVDTDHDALAVLCGGMEQASFLDGMGPGQVVGVGATGGDVVVFTI